ncbi:hypothetical protein CDEST_15339 [Colletotrichum destructivum]|uniref:Uncharacterized protein n=1 Tax=Colletotrichum destructivum TaxID=34406 RepID=A0AAX4J4A3_9PEZI|nr:hypothetical protein CDEST_15339 [Colletotrichum destructivum]
MVLKTKVFNWAILGVAALLGTTHAAEAFCTQSDISSCSKAIISTKTRTASLTSFCSSVLGCVKTTTTISGSPVTVTSTKIIVETYTQEVIETTYTDVATSTVRPTYTVEKFAITTRKLNGRCEANHPRNLRRAPTSICPPADETKACSCLIGACATPVTKDVRKTITEKTTETYWSLIEKSITYTNTEYVPILSTETIPYTWTETAGILSTHTTTIKCTPSATTSTSFFHLQATNAPDINGKYLWIAPISPRILSFSIEPQVIESIEAASVFSIDDEGRLITRHLNGTHFANADNYGDFQLFHMVPRDEIQRRSYNYFRCSLKPPSGKYQGGFKELYCKADGFWGLDIFNYCPLYKEWFNAGFVLGTEWSETSPDCYAVVFLVKPICGWT